VRGARWVCCALHVRGAIGRCRGRDHLVYRFFTWCIVLFNAMRSTSILFLLIGYFRC
jgi:hypothetical protein